MKKFYLAMLSASILGMYSTELFAQAKLVETVNSNGKDIVIPYEKYVLPNGLTLLIHEDHSDPIVHVDVTYHVGSAREEINKSGFAHFFEHMMFQGSDNVEDEAHFKIITEAGGTLNGTTNRDRTNYFQTVPSNQLEKMLWLESDRMGFLLDAVTQEKFEIQRATVKNERGQRYDNRPYGLVMENTSKNLYPYGHPYSWLTIGYIEDLDRVGVEDLKNFFLRWYGPNNAVLTIGGDVDPKEIVAWVEKYFGSIPRGPEVESVKMPIPELTRDRYISMLDNYAKLPMLRMVYPVPERFHEDEAALDCLAEILGQGVNSLFYQNFVKTNKAVSASIYNYAAELSGEFMISVTPYPGGKLSEMEELIKKTFEEFEKRGVTDEDIKKFQGKNEAEIIYALESVSGKVSQLASYYTFTGDANYLKKELASYASVTKEDVMRVYNKYIKDKYAVILSVTTKGNEDNKAGEDNFTVTVEKDYKGPDYGYEGLVYKKGIDAFDRKQMPDAGKPVVINAPKSWVATLPNNIQVIGTESEEIPVVNILMSFKGGKLLDEKGKAGTANLFAAMMNEDTENYSAEEFSLALEKLGSSINVSAGLDKVNVLVRTLSKNLDATMELLEEKLLKPSFNQEDFDRNHKRTMENVKNALNQPDYVASTIYSSLIYGNENPLGKSTAGSESSIANISLEDVKNYYKNHFSQNEAQIVVVGEVSKNDILNKFKFLTQLPAQTVELPVLPKAPKIEHTKVYFVDVPGAAQTEFRIGYVTDLKYDALSEFYKSSIMNFPLGGAFNSRLNLYLREEKGWTYGARSSFDGNKYSGNYTFSAGIKADATLEALEDVLTIIDKYKKEGISEEELSFTKNSLTLSEARKFETGFQKAGFLSNILNYSLPSNYTNLQNGILEQMTIKDVNSLAQNNIPNQDELIILLVGDKASLMESIKGKGFEVVELDNQGEIIQ